MKCRPDIHTSGTDVVVRCPNGHLLECIPMSDWAGSLAEARLGDPNYEANCTGCDVEDDHPEWNTYLRLHTRAMGQ